MEFGADYHNVDGSIARRPGDVELSERGSLSEAFPKPPSGKACCCGRLTRVQCGLVFLCLVGLLVVCMLVATPVVVQYSLDNSDISFKVVEITDPSADGTFFMSSGELQVSGVPADATMSASDMYISFEGKQFGRMRAPAMKVKAGKTTTVQLPKTKFSVTNKAVWDTVSQRLINNESVEWKLTGKCSVTTHAVAGLSFTTNNVRIRKTVALPGMQGMRDVTVVRFLMINSTREEIKIDTAACVLNPSVVRMVPIGDLYATIRFRFNTSDFAISQAASLNNSFPVMATDPSHPECAHLRERGMNLAVFAGAVRADTPADVVSELMSRYLTDTPTVVVGTIDRLEGPGAELFSAAVVGTALELTLQGLSYNVLSAFSFNRVMLTPLSAREVRLDIDSAVDVRNPLGRNSPMTVHRTRLHVNMLDSTGRLLGAIATPWIEIEGGVVDGDAGTFSVRAPDAVLRVDGDGEVFGDFLVESLNACNLTLWVNGTADAVISSEALDNPVLVRGLIVLFPNPKHAVPPVAVRGMCGLPDTTIVSTDFFDADPPGTRAVAVRAVSDIANPSQFGMFVGDMVNEVFADGQRVGEAKAENVTLRPGANRLTLQGVTEAATDAQRRAVERMVSAHLSNQSFPVEIRGRPATTGPLARVAWLQRAMAALSLRVRLPGVVGGDVVESMELRTMAMDFTGPDGPVLSSTGSARLRDLAESHIAFDITGSGATLQTRTTDGRLASTAVVADDSPVKYTRWATGGGGVLETAFSLVPLRVDDLSAFHDFMHDVMYSHATKFVLAGTSSPTVECALGTLRLSDLPFSVGVEVPGLQGMSDVSLVDLDIASTTADEVALRTSVVIRNPSNASVAMGRVVMDIYSGDVRLGEAVMPSFRLRASMDGPTTLSDVVCTYSRTGANRAAGVGLLSNFVSGVAQPLTMRGRPDSTSVRELRQLIAEFSLSSTLPGVEALKGVKMFDQAIMTMPANMFGCVVGVRCLVPTQVYLVNPFGVDIVVHNASQRIYQCDARDGDKCVDWSKNTEIGVFTPETNLNFVVPANKARWSVPYAVYCPYSIVQSFKTMVDASYDYAILRVEGTMTVQMGEFVETLTYSQQGVKACLDTPLHQCDGGDDWVPPHWSDDDCSWDYSLMECKHRAFCEHSPTLTNWVRCVLRPGVGH